MAPGISIPEGFELLSGRGRENAVKALALAEERGFPASSVRTSPALGGFLVPLAEGDEGGNALEDLTVADLKDLAEQEGVDLAGASKKADIVAAIETARATPADETPADSDTEGE